MGARWPLVARGATRGEGCTMPRAAKSPNSVASTFFNAVHLHPKDLTFENGDAKLVYFPGAIYPCYAPARGTAKGVQSDNNFARLIVLEMDCI